MPKTEKKQKTINLALQGGGAHGAFTWGVLDAFLEDGSLDFEGISATSAGAMNAAALAQGLSTENPQDAAASAREMLERFWREVADAGAFYNPFAQTQNSFAKFWDLDQSPAYRQMQSFYQQMIGTLSPYEFNPLNIEPLRTLLDEVINFDEIHACEAVKLFVTATNVRTGTAKIFENKDINIDVLLASAALPFLFQAVEIDDEAYWDGGYMGNPSLWPLFYHAKARDILIVHVNPIRRDEIPTDVSAIETASTKSRLTPRFSKSSARLTL